MMITRDQLIDLVRHYTIDNEAPLASTTDELIDSIIRRAEARIHGDLKVNAMTETMSISVPISSIQITLPPDLIAPETLTLVAAADGSQTHLQLRSRSWLDMLVPHDAPLGVPRWYCPLGDTAWRIAPAPATLYTAYLVYQARLIGLSASVQQTWLSTNAEDLLFKCILAECEVFHRNGPAKQMYDEDYKRELSLHTEQVARRNSDMGL